MSTSNLYTGMPHLNGKLLCSVFTVAGRPNLGQFAAVPLDHNLLPVQRINPFSVKLSSREGQGEGEMDAFVAADLFEEWCERVGVIAPLTHNWPLHVPRIQAWLGNLTFEACFGAEVVFRDLMPYAAMCNDHDFFRSEKPRYPKQTLHYLCQQLRVQLLKPRDALQYAVALAACYRHILLRG